ncbi:MAG: 4-hydroxy-tetrahydrodipicolinate synthase [Gammaproteobacteria bacterium]
MFHGSLVALATPFDRNGELDLPAFDRLIAMHVAAGTAGVVVAGTTGESPTLSLIEVVRLTERAVEQAAGKLAVIAGCGSHSTASSMSAARAVAAAGAAGCLVVTPYYNRPSQRGLIEHYRRVADAAQKPVILYNVPGRTGCDLLPESVAALADHSLIVAVKEATGSLERGEQIVSQCGDRIDLLSGDDGSFVDLMAVGAKGVISVTANLVPETMAQICAAAAQNNFSQAVSLNSELSDLHHALLLESNPMAVKWAMSRMGWLDETLRLPLVPLDAMYYDQLTVACERAGLNFD